MYTKGTVWWGKAAIIASVLVLLSLWHWQAWAASRDNIVWSAPVNLSNTPQLSTHPAIVADDYGYVHVFWSEEVGGLVRQPGVLGGQGNTIFYTRWNGGSWTPPIDILFVPGDPVAEFVAVSVGPDNRLHAVWTGEEHFYYSHALSWEAESAHAWSKPMMIATDSARSRTESSLVVDATGALHVVYATRGDGAGIYYIRSQDNGVTWTSPLRLSHPFRLFEVSYSSVQIVVDAADFLHVVWQTNQQEGYGQAVYYTRSIDNGAHWSMLWQFGYRDPGDIFVEWPYLTTRGEGEIHLIYIDGAVQGRIHRISLDNGVTWTEPSYIISELEGINGYVFPVIDGAGNMHLIANMRTRADQQVGVYYARWVENAWSPVVPLDNSSPAAPSAHYTAATVRLGSEIFVIYNQISVGEIWMLRGILSSVEALPALEIPQTREAVLLTPVVDSSPAETENTSKLPRLEFDWDSQPTAQVSEWSAIVLGLISSILLVGSVIVGKRMYTSHKAHRER